MAHVQKHESLKRMYVEPRLQPLVAAQECPNCGEVECDCDDEDKEMAELSNCTGQDAKSRFDGQVKFQRCCWVERSDSMGDPTIPRGTVSWNFARCLVCGAEVQTPYPDWLQSALPQKEYA